jgi:hypothetical protein
MVPKHTDIPKSGTRHGFKEVERFVEETAFEAERKFASVRLKAFHRFPVLFLALTFSGGVMTVYGFEHLIEDFTIRHPFIMLSMGLVTLVFTGALHKRLSK